MPCSRHDARDTTRKNDKFIRFFYQTLVPNAKPILERDLYHLVLYRQHKRNNSKVNIYPRFDKDRSDKRPDINYLASVCENRRPVACQQSVGPAAPETLCVHVGTACHCFQYGHHNIHLPSPMYDLSAHYVFDTKGTATGWKPKNRADADNLFVLILALRIREVFGYKCNRQYTYLYDAAKAFFIESDGSAPSLIGERIASVLQTTLDTLSGNGDLNDAVKGLVYVLERYRQWYKTVVDDQSSFETILNKDSCGRIVNVLVNKSYIDKNYRFFLDTLLDDKYSSLNTYVQKAGNNRDTLLYITAALLQAKLDALSGNNGKTYLPDWSGVFIKKIKKEIMLKITDIHKKKYPTTRLSDLVTDFQALCVVINRYGQ